MEASRYYSLLVGLTMSTSLAVAVQAAERGISAKKLLIKSSPKIIVLSKDALVVAGAPGSSGDPRCVAAGGSGSGALVRLSNGTSAASFNIPCDSWSVNNAGTQYKYKLPGVGSGKIKAGLLKMASTGLGIPWIPNGVATV